MMNLMLEAWVAPKSSRAVASWCPGRSRWRRAGLVSLVWLVRKGEREQRLRALGSRTLLFPRFVSEIEAHSVMSNRFDKMNTYYSSAWTYDLPGIDQQENGGHLFSLRKRYLHHSREYDTLVQQSQRRTLGLIDSAMHKTSNNLLVVCDSATSPLLCFLVT